VIVGVKVRLLYFEFYHKDCAAVDRD
jgi:hypothetical protein